jgi:hypothetical protein
MRLFLLLLATAGTVLADATSDLRATLQHLNGRDAVKARVTFELSNRSGDDDKSTPAPSEATIEVEDSPEGMRAFWSREMIEGATARGGTGEKPTAAQRSPRQAVDSLNVSTLNEYLNASAKLLHSMEHAELTEERNDTWEGKPARLLVFKLTPQLDERSKKYIKEIEANAKVWLTPQGIPLAVQSTGHVKGRAMLVITFESEETENFRFAQVGSRLVVTRHEKQVKSSGAGERGVRNTLATLTLL